MQLPNNQLGKKNFYNILLEERIESLDKRPKLEQVNFCGIYKSTVYKTDDRIDVLSMLLVKIYFTQLKAKFSHKAQEQVKLTGDATSKWKCHSNRSTATLNNKS